MKKYKSRLVFIGLIIAIAVSSYVAIKVNANPVDTDFDDLNFYKCVIDNYNQVSNSNTPYTEVLGTTELQQITNLQCQNKSIKSVEGIQKLKKVEHINLANNQLTDFSLSSINTLATLDLSHNNLTTLYLSYDAGLYQIYVDNNQLTSLDLRGGVDNLSVLNASNNKLTNVYLNKYDKLTKFDVSNNELSEITLGYAPLLTDLNLSHNNLTALDLSQVRNVTTLKVDENKLNELNLDWGENQELTTLTASHNNLTQMDFGSNSFKELNLSYNKLNTVGTTHGNINKLNLSHNNLTSLNALNVENLNASNNGLTNVYLGNYNGLTQLDLSNNELSEITLDYAQNLTDLNLSHNKLTTLDLSQVRNVKTLKVDDNKLNELNLNWGQNQELTTLTASHNNLTHMDFGSNSFKELNLSYNKLNTVGTTHGTIDNLNLSHNNLTSLNVLSVKQVNAEHNEITEFYVDSKTTLTNLDLSDNKLNDIDLSDTTSLTTLDLSNNRLMSLKLSGLSSLSTVNLDNQTRGVNVHSSSDNFYVDLVENDKNIDLDKITLKTQNINKDTSNKRFTFSNTPENIEYNYNTGLSSHNMPVTLILNQKKVIYNAEYNGGQTQVKEKNVKLGSKADLTVQATKEGWQFVGWNTNREAHEALSEGPTVSDDITLYAIFKKDVTATFYYNAENGKTTKQVSCTMYNKEESCNYNLPSEVSQSRGPNNTTYKGISTSLSSIQLTESYSSNILKYYAVYTVDLNPKFYYYDNAGQKQVVDTSSSGTRTALLTSEASANYTVTEGVVKIPNVVQTSIGPNGSSYLGLSKTVSDTNNVVNVTTENQNYYAYYQGSYKVTYQKEDETVNTISKEEESCTNTSTTNGTEYKTSSCEITLPTITTKEEYPYSGWYEETKKVGEAEGKYTVTQNVTLTAKGTKEQVPVDPNTGKEPEGGGTTPGGSDNPNSGGTEQNPNEGGVKPGENNQNQNKDNIGTQTVNVVDTLMNKKVLIGVLAFILIVVGGIVIYLQTKKDEKQ